MNMIMVMRRVYGVENLYRDCQVTQRIVLYMITKCGKERVGLQQY